MPAPVPRPGAPRRLLLALLGAAALLALGWWLGRDPAPAGADERAGATTAPPVAAAGAAAAAPATGGSAAAPAAAARRSGAARQLRGRVVDAAGEPLAGLAVHAAADPLLSPQELLRRRQRGEFFLPLASAATAADGSFALALPDPGDGPADLPLQVWALGVAHGDAGLRGVRAAAAVTTLPDLVLPPALPVHGSVVDRDRDAPLAGARVSAEAPDRWLLRLPGREAGVTTTTGADGAFRFANLPAGSFTFTASAAGHQSLSWPQQAVFADQPTELHFALPPGRTLAGLVVDAAGRGVAGAYVRAEPQAPGDGGAVAARSDASGRFALPGLGAAPCRLTAGLAGHGTAVRDGVPADADGVVLQLPALGAIRLAVARADGRPPGAVTVAARPAGPAGALRALPPQRLQPDAAGAVLVADLEPGSWLLDVAAVGTAPARLPPLEVAAAAVTAADVLLPRGATLRCVLRDAAGRPVGGATAELQPDGFADGAAPALAALAHEPFARPGGRTAADGSLQLEHLPAGAFQLRLAVPGRAPHYQRGVRLAASGDLDLGTLQLPPAAPLGGRATAAGAVDPAIVVQVVALPGGLLPAGYALAAAVDAAGRWQCPEQLPPGRYAVAAGRRRAADPFVENQDRAASRREVEVGAGPAAAVDFDLPARPQ